MNIAAFDFDGTLTSVDTFIAFARFSVGDFALAKALAYEIPALIKWKTGRITNGKYKQRVFSRLYRGMHEEDFNRYCLEFVGYIDGHLNANGISELEKHQRADDELCIVSASIRNWIEPWAKSRDINTVIATEIEVADGKLTGRFATPNCNGEEKPKRFLTVYPQRGEYHLDVYGDSRGDKPLMDIADRAAVIQR